MPNIQKIKSNKAQFLANIQEISKLINVLMSTTPVGITNQEIDRAMLGIESAYKVNLESLPDEDYEYKQKQEENIKHVVIIWENSIKKQTHINNAKIRIINLVSFRNSVVYKYNSALSLNITNLQTIFMFGKLTLAVFYRSISIGFKQR